MKNIIITYALSNTFYYQNEEYMFFSSSSEKNVIICTKVKEPNKRINIPSNTIVQITEENANKITLFLEEMIKKTTEDLQEFKRVLESLEVQFEYHDEKEICKISG